MAWKARGEGIDEADMRNRYQSKPERVEAILRNTKRWWDPAGECELREEAENRSPFVSLIGSRSDHFWVFLGRFRKAKEV